MKQHKLLASALCMPVVFYMLTKLSFDAAFRSVFTDTGSVMVPEISLLTFSVLTGLVLSVIVRKVVLKDRSELKGSFVFQFVLTYLVLLGVGHLPISRRCVLLPQLLSLLFMIPGIIICIACVIFAGKRQAQPFRG